MDLIDGNVQAKEATTANVDLLSTLYDAPTTPNVSNILDLFEPTSTTQNNLQIPAYHANDVNITLSPTDINPSAGTLNVQTIIQNQSLTNVSDLQIHAAVGKSQKLQLQSLSTSLLTPGSTATQNMKITASKGAQVKIRLKISFQQQGQTITDLADVKFPPNILV